MDALECYNCSVEVAYTLLSAGVSTVSTLKLSPGRGGITISVSRESTVDDPGRADVNPGKDARITIPMREDQAMFIANFIMESFKKPNTTTKKA